MAIKPPKYIRWVALVLYRSRVDAMNYIGFSKAVQNTIYGFIVSALFGGTVLAYFWGQIENWTSLIETFIVVWVIIAFVYVPYKLYDEAGGLEDGLNLTVFESPRGPQKAWWAGIEVSPKGNNPVDVHAKVEEVYFTHHGDIVKHADTWLLKPEPRLPWASGRMSDAGIIHIGMGDSEYLQVVQYTAKGMAIVPYPKPSQYPQFYELTISLTPYFIVIAIYSKGIPQKKILKIENCSMGQCKVSFVEKISKNEALMK